MHCVYKCAYNFESNRIEWKTRKWKRRNFYCKSPHILLLGNCDDGGKERERDPPDNYDDPSSLPLRNKVFHIVHCYTIQVWKWRLTAIVHTKTWWIKDSNANNTQTNWQWLIYGKTAAVQHQHHQWHYAFFIHSVSFRSISFHLIRCQLGGSVGR